MLSVVWFTFVTWISWCTMFFGSSSCIDFNASFFVKDSVHKGHVRMARVLFNDRARAWKQCGRPTDWGYFRSIYRWVHHQHSWWQCHQMVRITSVLEPGSCSCQTGSCSSQTSRDSYFIMWRPLDLDQDAGLNKDLFALFCKIVQSVASAWMLQCAEMQDPCVGPCSTYLSGTLWTFLK